MRLTGSLALHIALFLATIGSTYFVGGPLYSLAIMSILLAHEMGHYLTSRKYGVPSTLPYFIPLPLPPFGTFGAIIKMRGIIVSKRALFDIGAAGPLSGFLLCLPFIVLGIKFSTIRLISGDMTYIRLGDPLIFKLLQGFLVGPIPTGYDLVLHPFGYAGWVGLFVTALNLLPVGQLDGGHVVYAVFGRKSKWVFGICIGALAALAVLYNPGWLLLVILLFIFGRHHPEPLDSETGLDGKRKFLAFVMLIIFVLSFVPAPFPDLNFGLARLIGIPI